MDLSDKNLPLVTVIIPTIGRPKFIADTVRSVVNQNYKNIQIYISDNAPAIATSYALSADGIQDDRIEIIERPFRLDFTVHINKCMEEVRGEYVMILSDDDLISPNYLEEMVELMNSCEGVSVCVGRQTKINEEYVLGQFEQGDFGERAIIEGVEYLKEYLYGIKETGVLTYISLFAKRNDFLKLGCFRNYEMGAHADDLLMIQLSLIGKVAIGKCRLLYRVYMNSTGLSLPFQTLYCTTKLYVHDCYQLLKESTRLTCTEKRSIYCKLISNNFRLLLSRLRYVYFERISLTMFLAYLIKSVVFRTKYMLYVRNICN